MSRTPKSDPPQAFSISTPEPRRPSPRAILFAGVAAACVMGVGLGLWARPGLHERVAARGAKPPAAAPAAARQLEIVVDDHARAATGTPLEVLPAGMAPAAPALAAPPAAPQFAPSRPPEGLIRTQAPAAPLAAAARDGLSIKAMLPVISAAVAGAKVVLTRLETPAPTQVVEAPPPVTAARKAELAESQARELEIARTDAAKAEAHRAGLAKAEADARESARAQARAAELARAEAVKAAAARAEAHRLALAKAQVQKAEAQKADARRQELVRADTAKAQAAHKLALAEQAKAEKAETLRLAKAQARAKAAQREEARLEVLAEAAEAKKRAQLARLARALAHAVVGHDRPAAMEQARLDHKHGRAALREAQVQRASLKSRKHREPPRLAVAAHPHARPEPVPQPPASGLMRVSTTPHCASHDPGAALVCADPGLSAADRQMARAYQGARAAGVPDAQLQVGQQRWLAARSAAAREAPWAVRDVYMARIAELNGQAKEAQGGY